MSRRAQHDLVYNMRPETLEAGKVIIEKGDNITSMILIEMGWVEIYFMID